MTMTTLYEVVDAPVRTPYRFGLFSVLDFTAAEKAAVGLTWESLGCADLQVVRDPCLSADGAAHTKTDGLDCYVPEFKGFTVVAWDDSSLGRGPRQVNSTRPSQVLILQEQSAVEMALTHELEADADLITAHPVPAGAGLREKYLWALGQVEQELADKGGEGVILVSRRVATLLDTALAPTGSVLRTKLGTPVGALGGWDAADDRIYGLTALVAQRSAIATGQGWNTAINDNAAYAERDYVIGWDCGAAYALPA